jgi:pyruvate kinase
MKQMALAGADVFRLNFSHGTHDEHRASLEAIRQIAEDIGTQIAVLQDLCGPKIRLGELKSDPLVCDRGMELMLVGEHSGGHDSNALTSTYPGLADDLEVGQIVLFADGTVAMDVVDRGPGWARLKVSLPGQIRSSQGINVPQAGLSVDALTAKDLADLDWLAANEVDYVGLSFVRKADDIVRLRNELRRRGVCARIVAKIEKPQAVANLEAIIAEADAVMVARGDLGVEMDVIRVPAIQKQIIEACRVARVSVITATQMLSSMESTSRPTRAEASDVFNAVLDGTDAVMLSGETAIGQYPVEAVAMMSRIAHEAERHAFSDLRSGTIRHWLGSEYLEASHLRTSQAAAGLVAHTARVRPITDGIVEAASLISERLNAALLVVDTHSGRTALALSKHRNHTPTLALTDDPATARAMALFWGVTPLLLPDISDRAQVRAEVIEWGRARGLLASADRVVRIRGTVPEDPTHNEIEVYEIR